MSRLRTAALVLLALLVVSAGRPVHASPNPTKEMLDIEHTQLDNNRLRRENGTAAQLQKWLPLTSILVAVVGGLYGFWRYRDEQKRGRELRFEEDLAGNLERIVDRPADGSSVNARVVAALHNLDGLTGAADPKAAQQRKRVTDTIDAVVRHDLASIDTPDAARLPVICVDGWKPFECKLRRDAGLCQLVLARYRVALAAIRDQAPQFVASVTRGDDGRYSSPCGRLDGQHRFRLELVIAGYVRYTGLLTESATRAAAIDSFEATLNNAALTRQVFPAELAETTLAGKG